MDLSTNLSFLIIFGVFGFIISKIIGINPYRMVSDITSTVIIILLVIVFLPALINTKNATDVIPNVITVFTDNFPGIILGDIAGTFIGAITGD